MKKTIPFEDLSKNWKADPLYQKAYEDLGPEFDVVSMLVNARLKAGLTQEEVARKMGTTQSAVARLESGSSRSASLKTIEKFAQATGSRLSIKFIPNHSQDSYHRT